MNKIGKNKISRILGRVKKGRSEIISLRPYVFYYLLSFAITFSAI